MLDTNNGTNETNEINREEKPNYVLGALGALVGALIGGTIWAIVYHMGYFASWAGAVTGFLAMTGFNLLGGKGGKESKARIVIIVGIAFLGVILGQIAGDILDVRLWMANGGIEGVVVDESLMSTYFSFLETYSGYVLRNLGIGLAFAAGGLSPMINDVKRAFNIK